MSAAAAMKSPAARWQRQLLKWQAQLWLTLGSPQRAIERFDALLALDPSDAYALASRAHLRARQGDRRGAIADLRAAVAGDSGAPMGADADASARWFNLGYLLEQHGALDEAEAAFRRAIAADERSDRAWYGLALVLIRQRRFDEAVPVLETNTRLQPMSPHGWYQLARVHMDRNDPAAASAVIRHLKGFEPKVAAQLERETGLETVAAGPP